MSRSKKVATEQLRQLFGPPIEDEDVREAGGGLSVHVPRHYRVRAVYARAGGFWYDLSQGFRPGGKRHGSTRQTPGLGDLFVIFPPTGLTLWHETKAIRPADLAKKDWLASRFAREVVKDGKVDSTVALGICDSPELYEIFLRDLGVDRRLELYRRKQSPDQVLFQERLETTSATLYVLGGSLEALSQANDLPRIFEGRFT